MQKIGKVNKSIEKQMLVNWQKTVDSFGTIFALQLARMFSGSIYLHQLNIFVIVRITYKKKVNLNIKAYKWNGIRRLAQMFHVYFTEVS